MNSGKFKGLTSLLLDQFEDAWERSAAMLAMAHNMGLLVSRSLGGGKIDAGDLKTPDHYNAWLQVPGSESPDEETQRQKQEIIAKRKAACDGKQI